MKAQRLIEIDAVVIDEGFARIRRRARLRYHRAAASRERHDLGQGRLDEVGAYSLHKART